MEIISRVSKGTRMDQVYIPKNRSGLSIGSYVVITPIETKKVTEKPYFYNVEEIEPVKLDMVNKILDIIDKNVSNYENIIITGSFLDKGFNFNDVDLILISEAKPEIKHIKNIIKERIGIKTHIVLLDNKALTHGLSTDPLYQVMLSKCISRKRFIYKIKHKIDYKILDMHLLKSKILIDNFDILDGNEKYYLIRNMIAIFLYLQHKKIDKEIIDKEIERLFNVTIEDVKKNMLKKDKFLKKYKTTYKKTFEKIMDSIKNGSKQK